MGVAQGAARAGASEAGRAGAAGGVAGAGRGGRAWGERGQPASLLWLCLRMAAAAAPVVSMLHLYK